MSQKIKDILFYSFAGALIFIGVGFAIADFFIRGDWALDTGIITGSVGTAIGVLRTIFNKV